MTQNNFLQRDIFRKVLLTIEEDLKNSSSAQLKEDIENIVAWLSEEDGIRIHVSPSEKKEGLYRGICNFYMARGLEYLEERGEDVQYLKGFKQDMLGVTQ